VTRLLVVAPRALLGSIPGVFAELLDRDAELVFAAKTERVERVRLPDGILDHPRASVVPLPLRRRGDGAAAVKLLRLTADFVRFQDPGLPGGEWPRRRVGRRLAALGAPEPPQAAGLSREVHRWLTAALAGVERLLPPEPALEAAIGAVGADAVLLVSRCSFGGSEPDVIKTARRLGLPSALLVWSWDNLSSKAVLHEHPDRLLVWNEVQADEAERLHGVARETVSVVGAPNFDRFFAEVAATPARDGGGPAILYLGSSANVAPDETRIFARWLAAVRSSDDPAVRDARVVVRPHPGEQRAWGSWTPPDPGVTLSVPGAKLEPERLSRLLADADAVVALNTSAEIEAAIAGRPVVTFRAGPDAPGQEGSLHFRYLLEEQGGFVVDAPDEAASVAPLAAALRGDYDRSRIEAFVRRFVRPHGLDRPVAPLVAAAVLELAGDRTAGAAR
jgi:hypothetical protein